MKRSCSYVDFTVIVLGWPVALLELGVTGRLVNWSSFIWYRMPTKKAAHPSHIAGAEVLENTYRKATYKWSRRCTMMTAHGIPEELPTNRQ